MYSGLSGISTNNQLLSNNLPQQTPKAKPSDNPAGDSVSIGILTPEKTQALLNREIASKLEKYFKDEEGIDLKTLNADDFTPEKVSERILGFVSGRILSEEDNDKQKELMSQARKGIEQGFAEARDVLESLSVLNGKVKEDVDATYDLIQRGLDSLEQGVNGVTDDADNDEDDAQVQQTSAVIERSFARNENTRVEILTNDGDKILIDLFKQQSAQSSQAFSQADNSSAYSQTRSISASTGISYQVQGELDSEEQKAIDELLTNVAKVSDSFFSGNVQQAFKQSMEMGFDAQQLTRFSLDMSYQENRSVAITTYGAYQNQSSPVESNNTTEQTPAMQDMSAFIQQMDQLFQNPFTLEKMADSQQAIGDLINSMNQQLYSTEMQSLEQESSSLLDSLVAQLKERYSNETESALEDLNESQETQS